MAHSRHPFPFTKVLPFSQIVHGVIAATVAFAAVSCSGTNHSFGHPTEPDGSVDDGAAGNADANTDGNLVIKADGGGDAEDNSDVNAVEDGGSVDDGGATSDTGSFVPDGPYCGDGKVDSGEECDDGNATDGDGCDRNCRFSCVSDDPTRTCATPDGEDGGTAVCKGTSTCDGTTHRCSTPKPADNGTPCGSNNVCRDGVCVSGSCGDGIVESGEECDDGNTAAGDGCESDCTFTCLDTDPKRNCAVADPCQGTSTCSSTTHVCSTPTPLAEGDHCGNGGYCRNGVCQPAGCGNGYLEPGEECDDGNTAGGDGCESDCKFTCLSSDSARNCALSDPCLGTSTCSDATHLCSTPTPLNEGASCGDNAYCRSNVCTPAGCGNHVVDPGEECDDGNGTNGDGCDSCKFSCVSTDAARNCQPANECQTSTCNDSTHTCSATANVEDGLACATGFCKTGGCSPSGYGFVWYNGTDGAASPNFSYNSAGGTNTIATNGNGLYTVTFPKLGAHIGGDVQISEYGSSAGHCNSSGWSSNGTDLNVRVSCYNHDGSPQAGARFSAAYTWRSDTPGAEGGYVWAYDSSATSYTVVGPYNWNSTGQPITITRNSTGFYTVVMGGQGYQGTVLVTAYGTSAYCESAGWGTGSYSVTCFNGSGTPVDAEFNLSFNSRSPIGAPNAEFAWADGYNSTGTYATYSSYQGGTIPGATVTEQHLGTGYYVVTFPSITGSYTNVLVTGYYSPNINSCQVVSWSASGTASVYCFNPAGALADSEFDIVYSAVP